MNINILIYLNPLKCYKMNKKPFNKIIIFHCTNHDNMQDRISGKICLKNSMVFFMFFSSSKNLKKKIFLYNLL